MTMKQIIHWGLVAVIALSFLAFKSNLSAKERIISHDELMDKLSGFWIGQILGNYVGFPFENLYVEDKTEINIKTETLDMYSLKANYDKKNNIIELFDKVKIYRDSETISGDYAKINTIDESYKVTSKKSEKVS